MTKPFTRILESLKTEVEPLRKRADELLAVRDKVPAVLETADHLERAKKLLDAILRARNGIGEACLKAEKEIQGALALQRQTTALWLGPISEYALEVEAKIKAYRGKK